MPHGVRVAGMSTSRVRKRAIDDIVLFSLSGTASTELSVDTLRTHPEDALFMFVTSRGFTRRNLHEAERSSNLVLAPNGAALSVSCGGRWDVTAVISPRATLVGMVDSLPTATRTFPARRVLDRGMQRFVEELLDGDTAPTPIERYAIAQLLTEMGGAILLDRFGLAGAGRRDPVVARAMALISQQCADPHLTPTAVATAVQTNLRLLQSAFAAEGMTIAAEIRRHRAQLARDMIIDPHQSTVGVAQIAERAGFRTPMSLRRALFQEYGATPRELRPAARRPQASVA